MPSTDATPNPLAPYEVTYRMEYYGWCVHRLDGFIGAVKVAGPFRDKERAEAEAKYRLGRSILTT